MQKEMKEGGAVLPREGPGLFLYRLRCSLGKLLIFLYYLYYKMIPLLRKEAWKAGREKIFMMETFLSSHTDTGNYVLHIYPLKIVL